MKQYRSFLSMPFIVCMLSLFLLFFFPTQVLSGAKSGLALWFEIVLPTLLPFLITTNLCMELHIPELLPSTLYPVFTGLLSGYPIGAKACADLCRSGQLSSIQGQFLLSFCNNASPMFVLNYLFLQILHLKNNFFLPALLLYGSIFLASSIFFLLHRSQLLHNNKPLLTRTQTKNSTLVDYPPFFTALDSSILTGFLIITKIGGYIILFSILAAFISAFFPFSPVLKGILIGILEITTGINYLASLGLPNSQFISLTLMITVFGGLSSAAQTNSVISNSSLSLWTYLKYKALTASICTGLCILVYFI